MIERLSRRVSTKPYIESSELRRLLDSTGEAIYGIDILGNRTFCNATCLRLLGYSDPVELIGKHMHNIMHHTRPDGTPYPSDEYRIYLAFRGGEGSHVDDEVVWRADGTSLIRLAAHGSPLLLCAETRSRPSNPAIYWTHYSNSVLLDSL